MTKITREITALATETRVTHTNGRDGTILNGYVFDPSKGWTDYEVFTQQGIETWNRGDFTLANE